MFRYSAAAGVYHDGRMATQPPVPTLRPVRTGEEIIVEVQGGFVRRAAAVDGVIVQTDERDLFLPADDLVAALRVLGRIPLPAK